MAGRWHDRRYHRKLKFTRMFCTLTNISIKVGAVVVPQGMAYAKLAALPVQFGLYSSFVGVMIYWFFATSKE